MYELQNINQNLLSSFLENLSKAIKNKNSIIITKAVEFAIHKELPNSPKYLIAPIITKLSKSITTQQDIKTSNFKNENEAQDLFKKQFKFELDNVDKGLYPIEQTNMIEQAYELSKYDRNSTTMD